MRNAFMTLAACLVVFSWTGPALSEAATATVPAPGTVDTATGLEAWDRIYEVASHPRCSNCHTGASDAPMWSGPSYGKTRPHGMRVRAGESRIGAEYLAS